MSCTAKDELMKHFKIFFFLLLVTAACGSTDDSTESDGLTESELELRNESGDELNPDDKAAVEKWAADNNLSAERTESLLETFTVVAELYRGSARIKDAASTHSPDMALGLSISQWQQLPLPTSHNTMRS